MKSTMSVIISGTCRYYYPMEDNTSRSKSQIDAEIRELTARLTRLEAQAQRSTPPKFTPPPRLEETPGPSPIDRPASVAGNFMGGLAIFCFVFAASLLLKLGIESGWLTPFRQVVIAAMFGFGLIAAGEALRDRLGLYASFLPGGGIAVLYMSVYGGGLYYHLYSDGATLAAGAGVSLISVHLLTKYKNGFYAFAATAGSYLVPYFVPIFREDPLVTMGFFLLWDIIYSLIAIHIQSRGLILLASYLSIGSLLLNKMPTADHPFELVCLVVFQALQVIAFVIATRSYSVTNKVQLRNEEAWSFFPLLIFFYLVEYILLSRLNPDFAPYAALGFAGIIFTLYHGAKRSLGSQKLGSAQMIHAFVGMIFFHAFYLQLLPLGGEAWFGLTLLAAFPLVSKWVNPEREFGAGRVAYGLLVIFSCIISLDFPGTLGRSQVVWDLPFLNLGFCAVLIFYYLRMAPTKTMANGFADWSFIAYVGMFQGLLGSYRVLGVLQSGSELSFVVSIAWVLFALVILGIANARKVPVLAYSALGILLITAGRVFFFDIGVVTTLSRLICVLILGGALYVGGAMLQKIRDWIPTEKRWESNTGVIALVALLTVATVLHLLPYFSALETVFIFRSHSPHGILQKFT